MKVYSDKELKKEITSTVLFENQDYFFLFEEAELFQLSKEAKISAYLDLLPFGKIAKVSFSNKIGFFTLLGKQFDVRSQKLGDLNGNEQASKLIAEINTLFKQLSFNYSGITSASRKTNFNSINNDILAKFDYFKQVILSSKQPSFENSVRHIISLSHHKLKEEEKISSLTDAKNINLKEIFGSKTKFTKLVSNKYDSIALTKKLKAKGKAVFPSDILTMDRIISIDTQENQFIKFFLNEISNLCFYIRHNFSSDPNIVSDAKRIQKIITSLLANDFFRSIGDLKAIPYNSILLLKGNGYKELFHHYIKSRHSFHHILDRIDKEFSSTGLNDISYLYEVWCFLKVADLVFQDKINVLHQSQIYKNGHLTHKFIWKDTNTAVGFNITYSYSKGNSYSLAFRPDISLRTKIGTEDETLTLFDAKYKVIGNLAEAFNDQDVTRTYNVNDIHKMHSYMDGISNASSSFILYPGKNFIYFGKDFKRFNNSKINLTTGVGAIPLIPGAGDDDLKNIIFSLL